MHHSAHGVCIGGVCECDEDYFGPRCTLRGPPPPPPLSLVPSKWIAVSPNGTDAPSCGSTRSPCATIQHALDLQAWRSVGLSDAERAAAVTSGLSLWPAVTLLDGTYGGAGNFGLVLHGVRVELRSLRGPERTTLDCSLGVGVGEKRGVWSSSDVWGSLFTEGEGAEAAVVGFTLRKCLTEAQTHWALAPHPGHRAAVEGAARWPNSRRSAIYRQNLWVSH